MAKWNLKKGTETYHWLTTKHPKEGKALIEKLQLEVSEIEDWKNIAKKMHILYDPETKLFEEFEGYYQLRDVPITQYDDSGIPLFPEGLTGFNCGGTMLVKQADVIAMLYILADEFEADVKKTNFDFYDPRTMHFSSLSTSMHAIMAIATRNVEKALHYFNHTAYIDLEDNKGSTDTGMHIAAAGGTWQSIVAGFGGLRVKNRQLTFDPWIPKNWNSLSFKIKWHGIDLRVTISHDHAEFCWNGKTDETLEIKVTDKHLVLRGQEQITFNFKPEKQEIKV
jgi:kojibiose phosphorylase